VLPALNPHRAILWIILGSTLLHLLLASLLPLASHEAHYASYGYRLDIGYVDHPPLVGWLQAIPVHLLGGGDFALRLVPVLLTTGSFIALAVLTRQLYPTGSPWLPAVALLVLQGSLVVHVGFTMAPEVPFLTLAVAALWLTGRVIERDAWGDWIALGGVLGLAGLAKFSAITLAVSLPLALLLAGRWRALIGPRFWTAAGVAVAVVSPALIWNYQHEWASFVHQSDYQVGSSRAWQPERAFMAQLTQLAAYSPLLYIAGAAALISAARNGDRSDRLLLAFALPVLLVFFVAGGYTRGRVHWTLAGWVLVAPLAARWLMRHWSRRPVRLLAAASGSLSVLATILVVGLTLPIWRFAPLTHPYGELFGWREATDRAVDRLRDLRREPGAQQAGFLVLDSHDAEKIAWYARPLPVQVISPKTSQYPVWFGRPVPGDAGLLVIPDYRPGEPDPPPGEFGCRAFGEYRHRHGNTLTATFRYYRCGI
jgi:4-amino-4-deoxy-L-arabinose transferase-like glycosyltransferase